MRSSLNIVLHIMSLIECCAYFLANVVSIMECLAVQVFLKRKVIRLLKLCKCHWYGNYAVVKQLYVPEVRRLFHKGRET